MALHLQSFGVGLWKWKLWNEKKLSAPEIKFVMTTTGNMQLDTKEM
jgi:hypothetical protein